MCNIFYIIVYMIFRTNSNSLSEYRYSDIDIILTIFAYLIYA